MFNHIPSGVWAKITAGDTLGVVKYSHRRRRTKRGKKAECDGNGPVFYIPLEKLFTVVYKGRNVCAP